MTYRDPLGDNEFVVEGWCRCNAGSSSMHRHLGMSDWIVHTLLDGVLIFELLDDSGKAATDITFIVNDEAEQEMLDVFLLGLDSKYGEGTTKFVERS